MGAVRAFFGGYVWNNCFFFGTLTPNVPSRNRRAQETATNQTMYMMKKQYLTPDTRVAYVGFEVTFLISTISTGGSTGEDLDDPDPFDPWS